MSLTAPGVGGTFRGTRDGDLLFIYGLTLEKSALLGGTGGAGSKTGAHARGRAHSIFAAVLWQLGIKIALLFAKGGASEETYVQIQITWESDQERF
jgi:hypothetical protein